MDLCCLNKAAIHLRATARQCLTLHKFDSSKMILVAGSDVGGIDGKPLEDEDTVQGAWIIPATGSMPTASHKVKASVLSWRSAKLRRRVASTLGRRSTFILASPWRVGVDHASRCRLWPRVKDELARISHATPGNSQGKLQATR